MHLALAGEALAQSNNTNTSGTPPATATVAWNATQVMLQSPPAVSGLNNSITLAIVDGGNAKHQAYCSKHVDVRGIAYGGLLEYKRALNGGMISVPIEICGEHAVRKTFRVAWIGNYWHGNFNGITGVAEGFPRNPRISFGVANNCRPTHRLYTAASKRFIGSVYCWTDVTIID